MASRLYDRRSVEELQQRITEEWERLDQCVIDNAVNLQWSKRLGACVAANGGHYEYKQIVQRLLILLSFNVI